MKDLLLKAWQWPQCCLARILIAFYKAEYRADYKGVPVYIIPDDAFVSGVSLGGYILLKSFHNEMTYAHEWGHTRQSRIFGPLYLIVIGVASAVFNNLWDRLFHKNWSHERRTQWYYSRFPEAWADRLGGVNRATLL